MTTDRLKPAPMSAPATLRLATPRDAAGVHAIYAPVVRDTAISFEWEVPTVAEMGRRIEAVLDGGFPWLVADGGREGEAGVVAGYAYAGPFRSRAAYAWTAEVSVYVSPDHHRRGLGRALYAELLDLLARQGYRAACAVATAPNPASEALHRAAGFELVGRFPRVGWKHGAWHDVICWHRDLEPPGAVPEAIRPVAAVLPAAR